MFYGHLHLYGKIFSKFVAILSYIKFRPILQNSFSDLFEKRQLLLKENLFGHREFLILTNFMLNLEPPITCGYNESCSTAIDLILNNVENTQIYSKDFDGWRNAVNLLALYCIENRMKTFYGKPLDTFIAFDSKLSFQIILKVKIKFLASIRALMNFKQHDKLEYLLFPNYNDSDEENFNRVKLIPSEDFLRVNCFLSFVDCLEKFMAFAERGSILEIADISENSRQFFITNLSSCQGWVTRVSLPLLQVCYKAGR